MGSRTDEPTADTSRIGASGFSQSDISRPAGVPDPAEADAIALGERPDENETVTRVEHLARTDRPELCEMLEGEKDFPQHLLYLYQRPSGPDENLIARRDGQIDGLLTGTIRHDFSSNREFSGFDLPHSPHALLTRIHVRNAARRYGLGRALAAQFATEAIEHGCDFIGGYLDRASDVAGRRAFFERLGFVVSGFESFGARPDEVLASATR